MEETKWRRTTAHEKFVQKHLGRPATRLRSRKQKERAAELRGRRKSAIRNEKRVLGRRLTPKEKIAVTERLQPQLAVIRQMD